MKKSLIALAVMTAAGAASAQSSVVLFGIVDTMFETLRADAPAGVRLKINRLHNSGYNSSRLGFRGTEDLGGGMSASFWLEAGVNTDDGTGAATNVNNQRSPGAALAGTQGLTFNRRSTVSLAGGWGELRLGRDYVPTFWNTTIFDPFGTNGGGAYTNFSQVLATGLGVTTATRASNSVGYFLPANLGGIYGQAMYAFGETRQPIVPTAANFFQTSDEGRYIGLRLGYASGPFDVAASWGRTRATANIVQGFTALTGVGAAGLGLVDPIDYTNWNIGGKWDFGIARVLAQYNQEKVSGGGDFKATSWLIGALVPVGAGEIRASYVRGKGDDDLIKGNQIALGYVHNLSKRTAVYTTFSRIDNKNTAGTLIAGGAPAFLNFGLGLTPTAVGGNARAFDLGIRHSF